MEHFSCQRWTRPGALPPWGAALRAARQVTGSEGGTGWATPTDGDDMWCPVPACRHGDGCTRSRIANGTAKPLPHGCLDGCGISSIAPLVRSFPYLRDERLVRTGEP